jgi:hypothetical protein
MATHVGHEHILPTADGSNILIQIALALYKPEVRCTASLEISRQQLHGLKHSGCPILLMPYECSYYPCWARAQTDSQKYRTFTNLRSRPHVNSTYVLRPLFNGANMVRMRNIRCFCSLLSLKLAVNSAKLGLPRPLRPGRSFDAAFSDSIFDLESAQSYIATL